MFSQLVKYAVKREVEIQHEPESDFWGLLEVEPEFCTSMIALSPKTAVV